MLCCCARLAFALFIVGEPVLTDWSLLRSTLLASLVLSNLDRESDETDIVISRAFSKKNAKLTVSSYGLVPGI